MHNALDDGFQVILDLTHVRARLEVVTTPVREEACIDDVNLPDAPAVEALLAKQGVESVLVPYLDVAFA